MTKLLEHVCNLLKVDVSNLATKTREEEKRCYTCPELAVWSILVSLPAAGPEGQASLSPPVTHTHRKQRSEQQSITRCAAVFTTVL